jgi:myosin heavy subunit
MDKLELVAKLLGVANPEDLMKELLHKGVAEKDKTIYSPYRGEDVEDARDSFAKALYDNMFNWLVERMNMTILPEGE